MVSLIETSVWIDFTRARTPKHLKQFIAPFLLNPEAYLAEPNIFEVLCHATDKEVGPLNKQLQTFPLLPTPGDVWSRATILGQSCRKKGLTVGSIDLVTSAIGLHHGAEIVTFDEDFVRIADVSDLKVKLLRYPK